jgi:mitochondrial fission protein ELM1
MSDPVTIWRFIDGKPGHENQSAGLVQALAERLPVEVHELPAIGPLAAAGHWLRGRFPPGEGLPAPDLILGAGHATHLPMLAARRARGGRVVVLMKPSLPVGCFDLCLVPRHDAPLARERVLVTEGVLNRVRPGMDKDAGLGLILIGGPSKHHGWDVAPLLAAVGELLARDPQRHWRLTTSRRTPPSLLAALAPLVEQGAGRLEVLPCERTGPDWLPEQLACATVAWVTADSVSMVYEALTAGAAVGILPVPEKRPGRVSRGLRQLIGERRVVEFTAWQQQGEYPTPRPFNEAQRCARWIAEAWLESGRLPET